MRHSKHLFITAAAAVYRLRFAYITSINKLLFVFLLLFVLCILLRASEIYTIIPVCICCVFFFFKGLLTLLHISRSYISNLPVRYLPLHSWTKCHSHFFRFSLLYHFVGSIIVKKNRKIIFSDAIFLIRFPGMIKRRTTIPF